MRNSLRRSFSWKMAAGMLDLELKSFFRSLADADDRMTFPEKAYHQDPIVRYKAESPADAERRTRDMMAEHGMIEAEEFESIEGVPPCLMPVDFVEIGNWKIGYRYPRQQFDTSGKVFVEIGEIMEIVTSGEAAHFFLSSKHEEFRGRTGYHALQDGDGSSVVTLA